MQPELTRHYKKLKLGRVLESGPLTLVHTQVMDTPVTFCVDMERDPVQRNHRRGTFYELNELRALIPIFPKGGTFADIGANVGNHSLFAAIFLGAKRVIPVEPNRKAYNLLVNNVVVNGLREVVDLTKLGVGVSDASSGGFAMEKRERNLGGAKMLPGKGDLHVFRADELLADDTPDFIKIDVEGMEMQALAGLSGVLARCRPILMIEVDNENEAAFNDWVAENGYASLNVHQRYKSNKNHLIVDKPKLAALKKKFVAPGAAPKPPTTKAKAATSRKVVAK
ncbi:FkbM family methyltransferase [Roseobacter sp. YSTF-M11]|uniref:FkbM family methyltransferase n=1 Tax=Roseobacter insulae TaxID=2859783 RepID=A0A9X1FXU0_9RHOB|nr:FkbM family methyltransferase [Roseobacter insulae]MBW4708893.1 FkbM family methyltransferase [Roseobacter insulae]